MIRRLAPASVALTALPALLSLLAAAATPPPADQNQRTEDECLYLPPSFADRVVFYHSFEIDRETPEINQLGVALKSSPTAPASGLNGKGYRCPADTGQVGYSLQGPGLCPDRPMTVMAWWRLDAPMVPETGFNVLTLNGKGLIGSFVRGKGTWCALPAPRRVFQVYYFEGIANHNDITSETILIERPEWHHSAMTVEAGSDIRVYWDGQLKTFYSVRGRAFAPGDINQLCGGPETAGHPMTLDDVVVVDCVLRDEDIANYVLSVRKLADLRMPTCVVTP